MASVRIGRADAATRGLPHVCVVSGGPASDRTAVAVTERGPWARWLRRLTGVDLVARSGGEEPVELPVGDDARRRHLQADARAAGTAYAGVALVILAVVLASPVLVVAGVAGFAAGVVRGVRGERSTWVEVRPDGEGFVCIERAHPRFVEATDARHGSP